MTFNNKNAFQEWNLVLDLHKDYMRRAQGWRVFTFGLYYLHTKGEPGIKYIHGQNYKGFLATVLFWLPFEIESWNE